MEAPNALPAGHALQEYRIEKVLGVGGFGLTYLALDENLHLRVAVKEYLPADIALRAPDCSIAPRSEETVEIFDWGKRRFLDESRTLASFRHPNIVHVMRFFEANGTAYMVMEFVEGAPLPDWVGVRRPLAEAQVAALAAPLLDGLEVVHKAGFMHRDIKPPNIYIRDDSSPVLLDFGAARQKSSELTALVTPGYAPFEQYHTQGKQGAWSDIYALGGVLYWMVTGNSPHEAAARIRADTMPPALQAADKSLFRPEFLAAIDWALAPGPEASGSGSERARNAPYCVGREPVPAGSAGPRHGAARRIHRRVEPGRGQARGDESARRSRALPPDRRRDRRPGAQKGVHPPRHFGDRQTLSAVPLDGAAGMAYLSNDRLNCGFHPEHSPCPCAPSSPSTKPAPGSSTPPRSCSCSTASKAPRCACSLPRRASTSPRSTTTSAPSTR